MNFIVSPGQEAQSHAEPLRGQPLGCSLVSALITARTFVGRHTKMYPGLQFVHLADGKIYASNNRCLIEINLHDESLGSAMFSSVDLATIRAMGDEPTHAKIDAEQTALHWPKQRWCLLPTEPAKIDFVTKCQVFLDRFWHEGHDARSDASATMDAIAKLRAKEKAQKEELPPVEQKKFRRAQYIDVLIDGTIRHWHIDILGCFSNAATLITPAKAQNPINLYSTCEKLLIGWKIASVSMPTKQTKKRTRSESRASLRVCVATLLNARVILPLPRVFLGHRKHILR
ncbi:hypothetical protein SuNHUV7_31020 (plasmid) [Pseudoseohaeicola sp. NH-UV-7]|uniref:hypothetical protein n=1 Tax=Sulfitobacter sp. TBRI5 TaxID=2989732 RepID=UPI003A6DE796